MRPALHTLMFAGHPLPDVARIARDLGYRGIVLMTRAPHLTLDDPERSGRAARHALEATGLAPAGLASPLGRLDSYRGQVARDELKSVQRCADAAAALGVGLVRLWAGGAGLDCDDAAERGAALAWYRQAAGIIASAGAQATIEVHARGYASSTEATIEFVDEIGHPRLGVALDTGNLPAAAGGVSAGDVARFGPRLFDVHVKDLRALPNAQGHTLQVGADYYRHTLLGEGDVRNDLVLGGLAEAGYGGWIATECECKWSTWDEAVEAARHELTALRQLIDTATR